MRRGGTESVPFELSIVNLLDDPTVRGLVVSGHDITALRATRDALDEITTFDPLTDLRQPDDPARAMSSGASTIPRRR